MSPEQIASAIAADKSLTLVTERELDAVELANYKSETYNYGEEDRFVCRRPDGVAVLVHRIDLPFDFGFRFDTGEIVNGLTAFLGSSAAIDAMIARTSWAADYSSDE